MTTLLESTHLLDALAAYLDSEESQLTLTKEFSCARTYPSLEASDGPLACIMLANSVLAAPISSAQSCMQRTIR